MPLIRKPSEEKNTAIPAARDPLSGLTSDSADARWVAVRSCEARSESVPLLAETLARESDERVREAIFTALSRIAAPPALLVLLSYVRSDDANLRAGAMDALRALPQQTAPHVAELLADGDADVRLLACDLTRGMPPADALRHLCALLESDPHAGVCAAAVEVIAEIGDAGAVASLERCAARFPDDPFLVFAIKAASSRLSRPANRV
jgi:HEAT repeat protein